LTNVQGTNAGTYAVLVSDTHGRSLSSNAVLYVGQPTLITNQPQSMVAIPGGSARFSVGASGTAPLAYQWLLNGAAVAGATNGAYQIESVALTDIGTYTVVVSSSWLSVTSSPALLSINPQITVNGNLGSALTYTNVYSVQVRVGTTFTNGSVFYTLDGSTPDFGATYYTGPFTLSQSAVVRAVAYDEDFNAVQSFPVTVTLIISNTLTVVNPGGGSVALNPPGGIYRNTQSVQLTATPSNGWTFLQWSGSVSGATPIITVPMANNLNLRAVFGSPFTVTAPANGSIQFDPPLSMFPYGSTVEIYAVPAKGYYFALWGGGTLSGIGNPYALPMTKANPAITAAFGSLAAAHYSLTPIPNGNGGISVTPQATSYASNSSVQLTANAQGTNHFYYWTGDVTSSANPLYISMRTNRTMTANFSGGVYLVQFAPPTVSGTNFQFSLTGAPLQSYDVTVSTDFVNWSLFKTVTNTSGSIPLQDLCTNAQKYYRAWLH